MFNTTRVAIVFSLAVPLLAGCSKPPPIMGKRLPVSNAELGELIAAANAGQIPIKDIQGNISPLGGNRNAQARLLKAVALEQRDPGGAESAYGWVYDSVDSESESGLVAAGEFRRAELLIARGATRRASAALARARESVASPQDKIWVKIDGNWHQRPLNEVTEPLYRRLNQTSLTFRGLEWLAAHLPGSGVWRLLLGMVVMGLMLRVLEVPLFVKLVRGKGNTVAYRNFCISAFAFVEVVSIAWYTAAGSHLVFAFDAGVSGRVALVGYALFALIGGVTPVLLAQVQKRISEGAGCGLSVLVLSVAFASVCLWALGPLSATGTTGYFVMLLTGTLPAVLYAARKS